MLTLGDLRQLDFPDDTPIVVDSFSAYGDSHETSDIEVCPRVAVDEGRDYWDTNPGEGRKGRHRTQVIKLIGG